MTSQLCVLLCQKHWSTGTSAQYLSPILHGDRHRWSRYATKSFLAVIFTAPTLRRVGSLFRSGATYARRSSQLLECCENLKMCHNLLPSATFSAGLVSLFSCHSVMIELVPACGGVFLIDCGWGDHNHEDSKHHSKWPNPKNRSTFNRLVDLCFFFLSPLPFSVTDLSNVHFQRHALLLLYLSVLLLIWFSYTSLMLSLPLLTRFCLSVPSTLFTHGQVSEGHAFRFGNHEVVRPEGNRPTMRLHRAV